MRLISTLGTGLLVGTALIVIIPEGISTMYSASASSSLSSVAKSQMVAAAEQEPEKGPLAILANHGVGPHQQQNEEAGRAEELAHLGQRGVSAMVGALAKRAAEAAAAPAKEEHGHGHDHEHEESSHAWIGIALIFGFVLMYLIDAMQKPAPSKGSHIPLTQMDSEEAPLASAGEASASHSKSTTIGLVIHSFADGIALGASSAGAKTQSALGLVVFIAILVHKAPAAFGLTSVLLKQGLGKRAARGHLLLFSLAAPFGALATWTLVNLLGGAVSASSANSTWWTGLVLVFSGGTFL